MKQSCTRAPSLFDHYTADIVPVSKHARRISTIVRRRNLTLCCGLLACAAHTVGCKPTSRPDAGANIVDGVIEAPSAEHETSVAEIPQVSVQPDNTAANVRPSSVQRDDLNIQIAADGNEVARGNAAFNGDSPTFQPTVVLGDLEIVGQLDRVRIERVAQGNLPELRHCYELELQADPDLEGQVSVRFVITGDGSVASAMVMESDINNASLHDCVTRRIGRWQFPASRSNNIVIVSGPLTLSVD